MVLVVFPTLCCVDWQSPRRASASYLEQVPRPNLSKAREIGSPDPSELLTRAVDRYDRQVQGYTCTFYRQEFVKDHLTEEQIIEVAYRESPQSLSMRWVQNADNVRRLVYQAGRDRSPEGEECAVVEPNGAVARLVAGRVPIRVHGELARGSSRYTLDQFGFRATLERVTRINALAGELGDLVLRYAGKGEVAGRTTLIIERQLPYTGESGLYPDALLVLHLDEESLLPLAVYCYADPDGEVLLGRYIATNVRVNPPLNDHAFEF